MNAKVITAIADTRWGRLPLIANVLNTVAPINTHPICILGNQKTGTSAISALLASATGLSLSSDVIRAQPFAENNIRLTDFSLRAFLHQNKVAFSRSIIKEPNFTFLYEQLIDLFPQGQMVFIIRDPRDNIRSILDRIGLSGDRSALSADDLQTVDANWKHFLNDTWLPLEGDHYIERLAARWNLAADTYFEHPDRLVLVRYEDFARDKVGAIAQLAERLGKPVVYDITPQVDVQYQRQGRNRGARWNEFFGRQNLARIEHLCESRMRSFGYQRFAEMSQAG
jgi:hypothetical protein